MSQKMNELIKTNKREFIIMAPLIAELTGPSTWRMRVRDRRVQRWVARGHAMDPCPRRRP